MSQYSKYNEKIFRSSVRKALQSVDQILEAHRKPRLAADVDHLYGNKYELANRMTNLAVVAQMNCLERFGLTSEVLQELDLSKSTTLRFQASGKCTFLKDQMVEVPMEISHEKTEESQSTSGSFFGSSKKSTVQKFVKKIKEYHWTIDSHWEISVFSGTSVEKKIVLQSRDSSTIVVTQSKTAPMEEHQEHAPINLNLTWFLQQIDIEKKTSSFNIDTESSKTPRRNEQVDDAIDFFNRMEYWVNQVKSHFAINLQRNVLNKNNPVNPDTANPPSLISSCSATELFHPILPLMEEHPVVESEMQAFDVSPSTHAKSTLSLPSDQADSGSTSLLSSDDCIKLLNEQVRSIEEKVESLAKIFPSAQLVKLFSISEAVLVLLCEHCANLIHQYVQSIEYLEKMLEDQLIKAIGKRVSTTDLEQFVRYHNGKFLNPPPKPFCHAIGRPNHYPFGVLSIQSKGDSNKTEPIETLVRQIESPSTLKVPLNAATTLQLTGNTFLHGWMNHRCQQDRHKSYQLIARARQFSSFLLVVGTMMGPDQLQPKDAIILQNKDEVIIPLLLNELPSAKEFKDAIQSLSPEQQRFAKAFRSMQLESSVFGVCVIQIKPQLEALLGVPEDSLSKEIKLTEDLMDLFVEYQVPSDLLSFDGDAGASTKDKVDNVREHVQAVLDVIDGSKEKQLEDATMKADMAMERSAAAGGFMFGSAPVIAESRALNDSFGAPGASAAYKRKSRSPPKMAAPRAPMASRTVAEPVGLDYSSLEESDMFVDDEDFDECEEISEAQPPEGASSSVSKTSVINFTEMPKLLDASIEKYDKDSSLRSTVIKTSDTWSRSRQSNLLTKAEKSTLRSSDVQSEKNKAFDLLDALSRSGSLPIAYSDLHVLLCVTHCFEKDVMGTIVQDNINPIERLELSTLLLGATVYGTSPTALIAQDKEKERLASNFPLLLEDS